nr:LamG domain-containing protein [Acidiferrobacterales bacterium]
YNNGTDVGSATKTGSVDQANSVPVTMGNQPAGDRGFHGIIDDICIFDFALSPDQVAEFYDDGQGFLCDALPDNEPLDTSPPVITELSGVNSPTFDTTPRYIFSSSEAGNASFGGGCDNTPDTAVTAGAIQQDFAELSPGTYLDCTVQVTDAAGNSSNTLAVSAFTVEAPDTTPPTAVIDQVADQEDPTTSNIAKFLITFSEPIDSNTFSFTDLELAGSVGTINEDPQPVQNTDHRHFLVSVIGMASGDTVTINLPAGRVMDLAGNPNAAAIVSDNSVTYVCDNCSINDSDGDGIADQFDNCRKTPNPNQLSSEACPSEDELCLPVVSLANTVVLICL